MPKALRVVAVDLDVPVKGFRLGHAVEGVVFVPCPAVLYEISGVVIGEAPRLPIYDTFCQTVPLVITVKLLTAVYQASCSANQAPI